MINKILLLLCLWLFFSAPSHAQFDYKDVEIDLISVSPGQYYWSAFGHSAIRVKVGNYDKLFGFGYFNFNEEDFFLKFAKGEMQYFLGINESQDELEGYQNNGRKIVSQKLDLSTVQKKQLISKLVFLSRPENRYYAYDYFLNNCTSQIRDLLDEVSNGELSKQLKLQQTQNSWSDLTFPATNQTWMNLGIAYIYGIPAFAKKDQWQLSVFPDVFSNDLMSIETKTGWNKNLKTLYLPSLEEAQFAQYSFVQTHFAVILCVLVLLLGMLIKPLAKTTTIFWLFTQSLLGIGLIFLWFFTKHSIAMWNINLLIFSPFAFLLVLDYFKKPLYINSFLVMNITWFIASIFLTHLYLVGFCAVNLWMLFRFSQDDS